jgi:hypothetical protein
MKTIILVAAVAAFEFSFLASIATPPRVEADAVSAVQPRVPVAEKLAQRAGEQAPSTPPG